MARHCAPCRAQRAPWRAQGAHLGAPWRAMTRQRAHHGEPWRAMSRPKSIMARQGAPCRAQRAVGALVGTFGAAEGGGGRARVAKCETPCGILLVRILSANQWRGSTDRKRFPRKIPPESLPLNSLERSACAISKITNPGGCQGGYGVVLPRAGNYFLAESCGAARICRSPCRSPGPVSRRPALARKIYIQDAAPPPLPPLQWSPPPGVGRGVGMGTSPACPIYIICASGDETVPRCPHEVY
jgi:hypothetical protein